MRVLTLMALIILGGCGDRVPDPPDLRTPEQRAADEAASEKAKIARHRRVFTLKSKWRRNHWGPGHDELFLVDTDGKTWVLDRNPHGKEEGLWSMPQPGDRVGVWIGGHSRNDWSTSIVNLWIEAN